MFKPIYNLTSTITKLLLKINELKNDFVNLPITPKILTSLRESARLSTIHYSTQIEGNKLTLNEIEKIIKLGKTFPNKKRDEKEILGYHAALDQIKFFSNKNEKLTENIIQKIHTLVMGIKVGKNNNIKLSAYRDGQNAIYDSNTRKIVYLPPEANDLSKLMSNLVDWINDKEKEDLSTPLIAAITHYQFVTIHPYYDGNGRTARLLATLILHRGDYDLKGIYSLEEYYAKNLNAYYDAISVGPSHNYYMGREEADITNWITYFLKGMVQSFENIRNHALIAYTQEDKDKSKILRNLDSKQQTILTLFEKSKYITSSNIATFFNISTRTARALCQKWIDDGFLIVKNPAKRNRTYELNKELNKTLF